MTPEELAERGNRARSAYEHHVAPALEIARAEYMAALTSVAAKEPWASDKITKLAVATNIIDMVGAHLLAIMAKGDVAAHDMETARRIAELPHAKRRWI